jgi:hypothetical protein
MTVRFGRVFRTAAASSLIACAAILACSGDNFESGADDPDGSAVLLAIAESPRAAAALARFEQRHRVRMLVERGFGGLDDKFELQPAIPPGVVARFERGGGRVKPIVRADARRGVTKPARVELPEHASGSMQVTDEISGVTISFSLKGARPSPIEVSDGLAYYPEATADGRDMIARVTADGVEDYIVFDRAPAEEVVRYDVDVSSVPGLRLLGNVLEFVHGDWPVLRVAPPQIVGADGARHAAGITIEGCNYDESGFVDGRVRTVPPGAERCTVVISWAPE